MHTVQILSHFVDNYQMLAYLLILLIVIFEGEVVVISTGILIHLGVLHFPLALGVIFFGAFSKTFLGYHVGKMIHKKWNHTKFMKYVEKQVCSVMPHFDQKPFWSIFISKFIVMNHFVMIYSGYRNVDYKKYLKAEFISTIIWAPLLLLIGYFFSYTALRISKEIWEFSLIVLILFILFLLLDRMVGRIYEIFEEFYDK